MEERTLSKISFFGVFLTLVVISLGAWVRLTDAGLGCPDWPGCYGILGTPDTDVEIQQAKILFPESIIDIDKAHREMMHRYFAGMLGIYVLVLSFLSNRYSKERYIFVPVLLVLLIIFQSLLGMWTVTELVKPTIVTAHLVTAMITASLIFWNGLKFFHPNIDSQNQKLFLIGVLCTVVLIIQIIIGGWTSTNYASLACTDFPKCLGQWWPDNMKFKDAFVISGLPNINYEGGHLTHESKITIHFIHRFWALCTTALFSLLFIYIFYFQKSCTFKRIGLLILFIFLIQIFLGISNVVYSLPLSIAALHTTNASVLLLSMTLLLYYSTYQGRE